MKTMAVWLSSVGLIVATLALGGGLAFYKFRELQIASETPPPPEPTIAVVLDTATSAEFRMNTTMIGTVLAPRSIMLSNEIAGTVAEVTFEPGQIVEEDQVLVRLDSSVEAAQLAAAKARLQIAQTTFGRIKDAAAASAVTPSELDESKALLAQAAAEVDQLTAVIERKTLLAPFRGRIGLSDTHEGQFLPSGSQIASLQSLDDFVYVDFMVPQAAAGSVQVGQSVMISNGDQQQAATIAALDSQANRQSRNRMARARLSIAPTSSSARLDQSNSVAADAEPFDLVPGDSVRVQIEYGPVQTAAMVPVESLQSAPMQTFVYVAEPDKEGALRARERAVKPGPTIGGRLSLLEGLSVGEQVVADGAFKLRDGAMIEEPNAASTTGPAAEATTQPAVLPEDESQASLSAEQSTL